jgi:hypothetical protein
MSGTVSHSSHHSNRQFPISQEDNAYWKRLGCAAKIPGMDDYRRNILRLISRVPDGNLKAASLAMKKNHAYLQQFINKGTPRFLGEIDRKRLSIYLGVPEEELIPQEQKELDKDSTGSQTRSLLERYNKLDEQKKRELENFLEYLENRKN